MFSRPTTSAFSANKAQHDTFDLETEYLMCGFCGYAGDVAKGIDLRSMTLRLAHRGPDDEGFYVTSRVGLGHRRLAIIDLQEGKQPMSSTCGKKVVAYNGELYNYIELRNHLVSKGYAFRTRSDTEVLLYWLCEYDIEGLARLNGMFAFAFWDNKTQTLLLVRDRLGIKPLYYFVRRDCLYFASEIKALLPCLDMVEADTQTIFEFLTYQNVLGGNTFFKGISKLLPGHWLQWTPSCLRNGTFWAMDTAGETTMSFPQAVASYRQALEAAVARHMLSDVPVGAYLSGGLDSASVATLAASHVQPPLHTFTGAFSDAAYYDEREGSRAVARNIGAKIHEIEIRPEHFIDNFHKVVYALDEPTLGTGALPQYMVSRLVSQHVKVVLTGHGGDELFAGYQVNKALLIKELVHRNLKSCFSAMFSWRRDELTRILYYLIFPLVCPEVGYGLFIMTPKQKRRSLLSQDFLDHHRQFEPLDIIRDIASKDKSPGQSLMRLYLTTYLPTLFIQEDKVSMAHSVEARTPLCDNSLLELALACPLQVKLWGNRLKAVPRAAVKDLLPPIVFRLPKRGFPTPFARWYRNEPLKSYIVNILTSPTTAARGIFNPIFLKKLLARNERSRTDNLFDYARANMIYSATLVELWFRIFIDARTDSSPE